MGTALFDRDTVQLARFDQSLYSLGWFDNDLIVEAANDYTPPPYLGVINEQETHIYYGGGYFTPNGTVTEFAHYSTTGQLAAIGCLYGSGRVFLSGFHCEMASDNSCQQSDTDRKWLRYTLSWVLGCNTRTTDIIIYNESAEVYAPSVSGIQSIFDDLGISYTTMTASQINAADVSSYRGIVFPGGLGVGTSTNTAARLGIISLVNGGGACIGICSGAYAMSASGYWEESPFTGLGLFDGTCNGSIGAITSWPGEVETGVIFTREQLRIKKIGDGSITTNPYRAKHMDGISYKNLGEDSNGLLIDVVI